MLLANINNNQNPGFLARRGYGHVGNWESAVGLTLDAIEINKFMSPMLCDTWERILRDIPASEQLTAAIHRVEERLACDFSP